MAPFSSRAGRGDRVAGTDLNDRVVVITGASGGIGAAVAQQAAAAGASLLLIARRAEALAEVVSRCGNGAHGVTGDMTRRPDVQRARDAALARFGHVDVWVNNVGRGITRMPTELTGEDIDEMIQANVKSALYGMQEILPHFKSRGRGHIINLSSMLGRIPYVIHRSAYNGAKHFLSALTANFRMEVQQTHPDIQFSIISPGVVRTDFGLNARHGGVDSRLLPDSQGVEEVADVIVDVIRTRRPDVYTRAGHKQRVVDYFTALGEDP